MSPSVFAYLSTGLSTTFALISAGLCLFLWKRTRDLARFLEWPESRLESCELLCRDNQQRIDQVHAQLRRQQARIASRARRERLRDAEAEEDEGLQPDRTTVHRRSDESPLEWKRRMRLEIAKGKLGHG